MFSVSAQVLLLVALGAAAGGLVNGLAGFGTALFALGFFLNVMPPVEAVAVIVVLSVVTGLQGVWVVRHTIARHVRRLLVFLVPALAGIPIGLMALWAIEPAVLKLTIGAMMLLYGGYFSIRRNLPEFDRPTPVGDAAVGFLGGILGGAASLSGALPTMWCSMRPWPRAETRAVLQPYNVAVLSVTAALIALRGGYTPATLRTLAVALPVSILFSRLGIYLFRRISDERFRRLLIGMCFVSGTVLLLRELV